MTKNIFDNGTVLSHSEVFERARKCEMNNLCFISLNDLGNKGIKIEKSLNKNEKLDVWVLPDFI